VARDIAPDRHEQLAEKRGEEREIDIEERWEIHEPVSSETVRMKSGFESSHE
jgi:hypothetical protein